MINLKAIKPYTRLHRGFSTKPYIYVRRYKRNVSRIIFNSYFLALTDNRQAKYTRLFISEPDKVLAFDFLSKGLQSDLKLITTNNEKFISATAILKENVWIKDDRYEVFLIDKSKEDGKQYPIDKNLPLAHIKKENRLYIIEVK